ncbi:Arc family DNA-binding protein [Novosphingobium terrae]|uniref:Arc family DNA-binding protein n=1 Tax=Novosphingobium terrae TaxID=2726189 RepID=UPI00197CF1E8|nr:Arc family DNA-binding protein [Novosphingobium terrae]
MSDPLAHFPQLTLRIADRLYDRLKAAAQANHQSLEAEVIARLEGSFTAQPQESLAEGHQALLEKLHRLEDLAEEASHSADA